jgi:outer membrane receptor for ferrienterochelin and colicins
MKLAHSYAADNAPVHTIGHNDNLPPEESPAFVIMNAQVTRNFKRWEVYAGAENITNFTQDNPIISADNPFSANFDATNVWGPVFGRKIYAGVRYILY